MRAGHLRGALSSRETQRQVDVLAAYVAAGGSVQDATELVGIRPSTVKRHLGQDAASASATACASPSGFCSPNLAAMGVVYG